MTVQTATCCQVVDRYRSTVVQTAVIASRARREGDILRAIVNGVGIYGAGWSGWDRRVVRSAANSFVVNGRRDSATLVWHPRHAVIVSMRDLDGIRTEQRQLAGEHAAVEAQRICEATISEADWIRIDGHRRRRRAVNPGRRPAV